MTDPINPWLDADELKQLAESLMQKGNKAPVPSTDDAGFGDAFVGFAGGSGGSASSPASPPPAAIPAPTPTSSPAATAPPAAIPTPTPPPPASAVPAAPPVSVPSSTLAGQRPTPAVPAQPKPITIPPVIETHPTPPAAPTPLPPVEATAPPADPEPIVVPTRTEAAVGSPEQLCEAFQNEMHRQYGSKPIFILNRNGHTVFGKNNHSQFQFIAQSLTKHSKRRGLPKGHIHIKVGPAQTLEIIPLDLPNGGWVIGTVVPKPLQPEEIAHWVSELSKISSSLIQL